MYACISWWANWVAKQIQCKLSGKCGTQQLIKVKFAMTGMVFAWKPKKMVSSVDITPTTKKEEKEHSKTSDDSNIKPSIAKKQKFRIHILKAKKKKTGHMLLFYVRQSEEHDKEKEKEEKEKEKEKEVKPKIQAPTEDFLGDFVVTSHVPNVLAPNDATWIANADRLCVRVVVKDDWLDEFAVDNKQFENGGLGEDGGQFEFGASDDNDFFDKNELQKDTKKEENVDNVTNLYSFK
ncbi:hypothetical protein RFI_16644 [Reticulomyxa filosa]|uniref:Uncharacterized protein n=1 Tax=Reticulomyxa filosa TaxID=46433 RepID=X6N3C5_RETFI|nr:hypothetical protein RFI_16644 [Reticulomyxa filosa]|eukprot:ETO20576.1 hypothetical protein RFI_16644 [Reticulomyxa filosa]